MEKRELSERKHTIRSKPYLLLAFVQLSERCNRIIVKLLGKVVTVQDLLGPSTRFAGGQHVGGKRMVNLLSSAARHSNRRDATGQREKRKSEKENLRAFHAKLARYEKS